MVSLAIVAHNVISLRSTVTFAAIANNVVLLDIRSHHNVRSGMHTICNMAKRRIESNRIEPNRMGNKGRVEYSRNLLMKEPNGLFQFHEFPLSLSLFQKYVKIFSPFRYTLVFIKIVLPETWFEMGSAA